MHGSEILARGVSTFGITEPLARVLIHQRGHSDASLWRCGHSVFKEQNLHDAPGRNIPKLKWRPCKAGRPDNPFRKLDRDAIIHALPTVVPTKNPLLTERSRQKFSRTVLCVISALLGGPAFITLETVSFYTCQPMLLRRWYRCCLHVGLQSQCMA